MTIAEQPTTQAPDERGADLVLARLHLRLGSLGLARAELEAMAGRNALDDEGIRDLAEVRWRTGDLPGAGDAAGAYLEIQPDDVLGLVITAEVQAHLGRPGEARRLAGRALTKNGASIDSIFAGMPRSAIWPIDPGDPIEPAGTLFTDLPAPIWPAIGLPAELDGEAADFEPGLPGPVEPVGPSLWDAHSETIAPALPSAGELVARARAALDIGRPGQASAALALALRADPTLAPSVLDLIAGRPEPVLALVRGDAHRIVGHEAEALRDYAAAVPAIELQRRSDDRRPETAPSLDLPVIEDPKEVS
jgi:tetratricopeptide (TPR) repeat protein